VRALAVLAAALATVAACASAGPMSVVPARELSEASGRPRISEVVDLGGIDLPEVGALRPHASDGVAVIGEALWIRGSDFGRQPTVQLGGRVATVVSRTGDGGILVRVPVGTPPGQQALVVVQEDGQAEKLVNVRRLGAVIAADKVTWLDIGAGGPGPLDQAPVVGVRHLQLSADARAAYTLDGRGQLDTHELPAAGAPAKVGSLDVGQAPVRALLAARTAHRLIVLREGQLSLIDTRFPLRPALDSVRVLPRSLNNEPPIRAALSPDGRLLAMALAGRNRVVVLAVDRLPASTGSAAAADHAAAELALLPDVLAPVLVDLAFSSDGATLWALSGSNDRSRALGPQPTALHALRLQAGGPVATSGLALERARSVILEGVTTPAALAPGRSLALTSGSAVRLPPEKATVFLAARTAEGERPALYAVGAGDAATPLLVDASAAAVGGTDITPDGRWVIGAFVDREGALRIASAPADGRPGQGRSFVVASQLSPSALAGVELRIQP
jgi:hypothetical protein